MGNSNHTLIIIKTPGTNTEKVSSDESKEEMENRPKTGDEYHHPGHQEARRQVLANPNQQQRRIKTPRPAEPRAAGAGEEPHKIPKKVRMHHIFNL